MCFPSLFSKAIRLFTIQIAEHAFSIDCARVSTAGRQRAGIAIAKAKGIYKGRKPIDDVKIQQVTELVETGLSIVKACSEVGIGRTAYYKHKV